METTVVVRMSPFTQRLNSMTIPLSTNEYVEREFLWHNGMHIQDAFPMLTPGQREFIKTGITEMDWDAMFGAE